MSTRRCGFIGFCAAAQNGATAVPTSGRLIDSNPLHNRIVVLIDNHFNGPGKALGLIWACVHVSVQ